MTIGCRKAELRTSERRSERLRLAKFRLYATRTDTDYLANTVARTVMFKLEPQLEINLQELARSCNILLLELLEESCRIVSTGSYKLNLFCIGNTKHEVLHK